MILDPQASHAIGDCAAALRAGELVAFPTETVYGLGADAVNDAAVEKIFAAKGRPIDHPLIVHVSDQSHGAAAVAHFATDPPGYAGQLMKAFWPGPLTLILRRREGVARAAAGGQDSIGLRCPAHPVAQDLLHQCQALGVVGLAAPSANQFGRVSPTAAAHVLEEFGTGLPILDGGACEVGIESTIVDCTRGAPVLLRPGAITSEQLRVACGQAVLTAAQANTGGLAAPRVPGALEAHYATRAKLRLMDAASLQIALNLLGTDIGGATAVIAVYARAVLRSPSAGVLCRRMPDDAAAAGQQLFAVLREFDARGVKLIWVETPPESPAWAGVLDRLQRAAAA